MAKGFKHGAGGGTSLNFKVVGGTAEPAKPKENMIWLDTDTKITSWAFRAAEPETPAEGMIWISTGASSTAPFNALKKNGIQVYPLYAKQYVSGAWVDVDAKSYQNGAWVDWWNGHLYEYGNLHEQVTGGWTTEGYTASGYSTLHAQFNSNHIYIWGVNNVGPGGAGTVNKIDLSGRAKLHILADVNSNNTTKLCVVKSKSDDMINSPAAQVILPQGTKITAELDISAITEGYIAVSTGTPAYIYDIWLE